MGEKKVPDRVKRERIAEVYAKLAEWGRERRKLLHREAAEAGADDKPQGYPSGRFKPKRYSACQ